MVRLHQDVQPKWADDFASVVFTSCSSAAVAMLNINPSSKSLICWPALLMVLIRQLVTGAAAPISSQRSPLGLHHQQDGQFLLKSMTDPIVYYHCQLAPVMYTNNRKEAPSLNECFKMGHSLQPVQSIL